MEQPRTSLLTMVIIAQDEIQTPDTRVYRLPYQWIALENKLSLGHIDGGRRR